jgi:hypothetical protein
MYELSHLKLPHYKALVKTKVNFQLDASSPGAKQYGEQGTNRRMDKVSYRGAKLAPKKIEYQSRITMQRSLTHLQKPIGKT